LNIIAAGKVFYGVINQAWGLRGSCAGEFGVSAPPINAFQYCTVVE
jgi:hypothetical protein